MDGLHWATHNVKQDIALQKGDKWRPKFESDREWRVRYALAMNVRIERRKNSDNIVLYSLCSRIFPKGTRNGTFRDN